jgi:predicted esterase
VKHIVEEKQMADEKIICLCLHGCCQTPETFSSYLNSLKKMAKKKPYQQIEFHFLKAPFEHPDGGLTWTDPPLVIEDIWRDKNCYETRKDATTAVLKLPYNLSLLNKSFNMLENEIHRLKPQVLLGSSQGAFMVYEYMRNKWTTDSHVKRIVAMSGYTFNNVLENENHDFDILNVVNPMDNVVPSSVRFEKAKNVYLLQHNNKNLVTPCREGHVVPTRNGHMRTICRFMITGKFIE